MKLKLLLLIILNSISIYDGIAQSSEAVLVINLSFLKDIESSVKKEARLFIFLSQNANAEPRNQYISIPLLTSNSIKYDLTLI